MKSSFKYGIIAGIMGGIIFYAEYFSGISEKSSGLFSLAGSALILVIFIFFYLRKIVKPQLNGFYTFGYGFKNGMMVVASMALTMALFTYIFFTFINPGYLESLMADGIEQMKNNGAGEEEIKKAVDNFKTMHTPFFESVKAMIRILFLGAFFSAVNSLAIKIFNEFPRG